MSKICSAVIRVRDRSWFPRRVNETNALQLINTKKTVTNESDGGFHLSLSGACIQGKYIATVVIKSLKEVEGVSVRARV